MRCFSRSGPARRARLSIIPISTCEPSARARPCATCTRTARPIRDRSDDLDRLACPERKKHGALSMPMQHFKLEIDGDGIALVTWDSPGRTMNVIDPAVIGELGAIVDQVA